MKRSILVVFLVTSTACMRTPSPDREAGARPSQVASPAAAAASQKPLAAGPILRPVDEAPSDASFVSFRSGLLRAVEEKDAAAVRAALDPGIRLGFGGEGGRDDFDRMWHPEDRSSRLWPVLDRVLSNGGAFQNFPGQPRRFCAPFVYTNWPASVDAFTHVVAAGDEVMMRAGPSADAPLVGRLAWTIVEIPQPAAGSKAPEGWRRVRAESGEEGWVREEDLLSPVGYRACFAKEHGDWKMTLLVAGD